MKHSISVKLNVNLTDEDIEDIMVAALEGGIGYWACLDNTGEEFEKAPKDEPVSITCAKLLLKGERIRFFDAEDDKEVYELTLAKFLNGFAMWCESGGDIYHAVAHDGTVDVCNIDACCADEIVQYAIFEDIVFG